MARAILSARGAPSKRYLFVGFILHVAPGCVKRSPRVAATQHGAAPMWSAAARRRFGIARPRRLVQTRERLGTVNGACGGER